MDIGSNWVLNPNHDLKDIEAEFDETAADYECSSENWDYRGARNGAAFFQKTVLPDTRVLEAGCGSLIGGMELHLFTPENYGQVTGGQDRFGHGHSHRIAR